MDEDYFRDLFITYMSKVDNFLNFISIYLQCITLEWSLEGSAFTVKISGSEFNKAFTPLSIQKQGSSLNKHLLSKVYCSNNFQVKW